MKVSTRLLILGAFLLSNLIIPKTFAQEADVEEEVMEAEIQDYKSQEAVAGDEAKEAKGRESDAEKELEKTKVKKQNTVEIAREKINNAVTERKRADAARVKAEANTKKLQYEITVLEKDIEKNLALAEKAVAEQKAKEELLETAKQQKAGAMERKSTAVASRTENQKRVATLKEELKKERAHVVTEEAAAVKAEKNLKEIEAWAKAEETKTNKLIAAAQARKELAQARREKARMANDEARSRIEQAKQARPKMKKTKKVKKVNKTI